MKKTAFHENWTVKHLGSGEPELPVTLPDDAMLREERSTSSAGGLNVGWFAGADYLYTCRFSLTEEEARRHTVLEFEGVYRKARVLINGKEAAYRPYGYTNFFVDCDAYLTAGENIIEVEARNADQPNSRWYSGAGIYRPVSLWTAKDRWIAPRGLTVRTLSLDPARIEVNVETNCPGPVSLAVLDGETEVARVQGTQRNFVLEVPDAKPWSPDSPHLYRLRAVFGEDEAEERFGIRTLSWGQDGLLLNGERVILRGACIHHDNGVLGAKTYADAEERRIRLLLENGYNAVRSAHNPISQALLEACDRLGCLVMDEYIDHWYIHKTLYDYVDDFDAWWKQDLKDMVEKDRNHPSVILYSTGNEVAETADKRGIALCRELTEYLHGLDDSRPVTCGINIFFNYLNSLGFGQYSDEKAKKEAQRLEKARREGKKASEKATGSKFFNDMAGLFGADFMKMGAALRGSDRTTRDAFAQMDIAGYNYGEKRYEKDLRAYPERLILGSETFCSDAYRFWELAKKEKRLIGDFVWSGIDYLGEVGIGAWEYHDYAPRFDNGPGWISAGAGRIDLTGLPLGEASYTRVAFEQAEGPFLAVRPICHEGKHSPSAWKMTNAMPSWSFRGFEGKKALVEVYARADACALFLNGRLVRKKKAGRDCRFLFTVPYENGVLEAVTYDMQGREKGRTKLETAGEETVLSIRPEEDSAGRGRLAFVRLCYTDAAGTVKPTARGKITLEVTGGKLLGFGSACPYAEGSYLDSVSDTYYGQALAVIESEGKEILIRGISPYGEASAVINAGMH